VFASPGRIGRTKRAVVWIVTAAACLGAAPTATASDFIDPALTRVVNPRSASMGGPYAAWDNGVDTLFANPAALATADQELQITELTVRLSGPVFSLSSAIAEAIDDDPEEVLTTPEVTDLTRNLYTRVGLTGPIAFGFVGEGVGFGLFTDTGLRIETVSGRTLELAAEERLLAVGGVGFRLPLPADTRGDLYGGVIMKGFMHGESSFQEDLLEIPDLVDDADFGRFLDEPFVLTTGVGFDLGLRYARTERLTYAVTAFNVLAPAVETRYASLDDFLDGEDFEERDRLWAPTELNLGVRYRPETPERWSGVEYLQLYADYRDAIDFLVRPDETDNIALKPAIGAELRLLKVLSLRAGFARGLPAAGFGIDAGPVEINTAVFGTELSGEPGLRPVFNAMFGARVRL